MIARTAAFLLVALVVLLGAGCGGDDSDGGNGTGATGTDASAGTGTTDGSTEDADSSDGGDGVETTVESSSLTKAQFVKQAQAICERRSAELQKQIGPYLSQPGDERSEGERSADATKELIIPNVETQLEEIQALGAPTGDEAQIEAFFAAMQQALDTLGAKENLSLEDDLAPAFRQSGKLARQYGLVACSYG